MADDAAAIDPWLIRWGLRNPQALPGSRYNQVWAVDQSSGGRAVLKLGDPTARRREAAALRCWQGDGATTLLAAHGPALLTSYVQHTATATALRDDDATAAVGAVMAKLHRASVASPIGLVGGPGLPSVAELPDVSQLRLDLAWLRTQRGPQLPADLVAAASARLDELLAPPTRRVVLHGDLHHENILLSAAGPMAIDPHGWVGDPHFDAASLLANPHGEMGSHPNPERLARRRAGIIAEACDLDIGRLLDWTLVGCVIAEIWCLQDHQVPHGAPLRLAQALHGSEAG